MIRNLPNKFRRCQLIRELSERMPERSFDFVYMPFDFGNRCNYGYAFVNLTSPDLVPLFFEAFHNKKLTEKRGKLGEVVFARVQGFKANVDRLASSRAFASIKDCEEDALPVVCDARRETWSRFRRISGRSGPSRAALTGCTEGNRPFNLDK